MIKYIFIYVIIFFSFKSDSCNYISDYYQTVYKAEIHYLKNENQEALKLLKKVESNCGLLNQIGIYEPLIMAELLVRTKQEDKAFPYLYRLLRDGLTFEMLTSNPEFDILKTKKQWLKLKKEAPELENEFQKSINQELRNEIINMNIADQKARTGDINYQELKTIDSINEKRMKEIFIEYGYPNYKLVGHSINLNEDTDIGAMLMHFKDTVFFKPQLLKFISNGEAPPSELASMIDSQQRSVGEFTYGIYQNIDSTKIKNFENIDQTRTAIGLRPYEMDKEYWKLIRSKYNFNN
jgi:hypothetical protein